MKIYTRTGDKGQTSLLGGKRVPKDHDRIEAYGTVDELNSHIGMLRDLAGTHQRELLISIQEKLFSLGSRLASASNEEADKFKVPHVEEADITALEPAMDAMSQAHICRTVCRRAERLVVSIAEQEQLPETVVRYLNRLSDLLFMLARWLGHTLGAEEIPWKPRG